MLDVIYDKRPIQRFWFLEVVARMPYFSYISMLHLYESLGWWRAGAELRRVSVHKEPHLAQHRPSLQLHGVSCRSLFWRSADPRWHLHDKSSSPAHFHLLY